MIFSGVESPRNVLLDSFCRYGIEAVKRYGAFKGGVLLVWRLIRCTPLVSCLAMSGDCFGVSWSLAAVQEKNQLECVQRS